MLDFLVFEKWKEIENKNQNIKKFNKPF